MPRLSLKALAVGLAADIGGSAAFGALVGLLLKGASSGRGGPGALKVHFVATLAGGLFCTALGGFLAGRIARQRPIFHGTLVGAFSLALGLVVRGSEPAWFDLASSILVVPAGALGGWLADRRQGRMDGRAPIAEKRQRSDRDSGTF
jgi:hypothetical protein